MVKYLGILGNENISERYRHTNHAVITTFPKVESTPYLSSYFELWQQHLHTLLLLNP